MDDERPVCGLDHADLVEVPAVVRSDKHREAFVQFFGSNRVVERLEDVVVAYTVLARAGRSAVPLLQVPWSLIDSKVTCEQARVCPHSTSAAPGTETERARVARASRLSTGVHHCSRSLSHIV
jgi:hypothetical protein